MKRKLNEVELKIVNKQIGYNSKKAEDLKGHREYFKIHSKHALAISNYQFLKMLEQHKVIEDSVKTKIIDDYKLFLDELDIWYKENASIKAELLAENYETQVAKIDTDIQSYSLAVEALTYQVKNGVEIKEKPEEKDETDKK